MHVNDFVQAEIILTFNKQLDQLASVNIQEAVQRSSSVLLVDPNCLGGCKDAGCRAGCSIVIVVKSDFAPRADNTVLLEAPDAALHGRGEGFDFLFQLDNAVVKSVNLCLKAVSWCFVVFVNFKFNAVN